MFIDDYTPTKRIGMEELEGCVRMFEYRIDDHADDEIVSPTTWMDEGASLALRLILTGRFRYPTDFMDVFDMKRAELFGLEGEQ